MNISMYQASITFRIRSMNNLGRVDPSVLINALRRVQIATDVAKGCGLAVSGVGTADI